MAFEDESVLFNIVFDSFTAIDRRGGVDERKPSFPRTQSVFLKSHNDFKRLERPIHRDPVNCNHFGDAVIPPGH